MPEPIQTQVLATVAERLAEIAVVGAPTYRTAPALVTRSLLSIDQYQQELEVGPVLGVMRTSGCTFEPITQTSRRHRIRFTVWGYVRGDAVGPAGEWLDRLWDDTVRCLLTDPKLGGLVMDLDLDGGLDTDDGALEPQGFFAQDWAALVDESTV
jgi:hypothetical protein